MDRLFCFVDLFSIRSTPWRLIILIGLKYLQIWYQTIGATVKLAKN